MVTECIVYSCSDLGGGGDLGGWLGVFCFLSQWNLAGDALEKDSGDVFSFFLFFSLGNGLASDDV